MEEDGRILLIPVEAIPKQQLWAWTPESEHEIEVSMSDPRPPVIIETPAQARRLLRWADED